MAKIIDPDSLVRSTTLGQVGTDGNIWIDTATGEITLDIHGLLSTDGVTMQAFYSYLKEEWKTDAELIKFPFPMVAITPEQFEFVDTWAPADQVTSDLFRDGGYAIKNANGSSAEEYVGVITLGTLGGTDQVYFQQVAEGTAQNITLQGVVNQCVKVYGDGAGHGIDNAGAVDYRTYFKIFVREYQKIYAQSELLDIGVSTFTYQAYRFPLANATDLKITNSDEEVGGTSASDISGNGTTVTVTATSHGLTADDLVTISGSSTFDGTYIVATVADVDTFTFLDANAATGETGTVRGAVYGDMDITYLDGNNFYTTDQTNYVVDDVVQDGATPGRWYICTGDGTTDATDYLDLGTMGGAGTATFSPYLGERLIGAIYYAFNVVVDADVADDGSLPTAEEIYEFVQYSLRLDTDIDAGTGSVIGETADGLLAFVGDTLVTSGGVFIDDFSETDINRIEFYDTNGVKQTFPFVAAGTINFNANLVDDTGAIYRMFFTDANGNNFGDTDALLVNDNDLSPISGDISTSSVQFTFDYDGNEQGGRSSATDAPVTVVAIGLDKAQYVKATSTIGRSNANSVSLVASLERNYSNPA